jgi:ABC-type sulfate transport system substrate-binding protein
MGIAIEASIAAGRALAELAADAVGDDTRQDESHAGDADQVRNVLVEGSVAVVVDRAQVHDDVKRGTDGHQQQAKQHEQRDPLEQTHAMYH